MFDEHVVTDLATEIAVLINPQIQWFNRFTGKRLSSVKEAAA